MDIHDVRTILLLTNCYSYHFKVSLNKDWSEKGIWGCLIKKRQSVFRLPFLVLVIQGERNTFLKESQNALLFLPQASVPTNLHRKLVAKGEMLGAGGKEGKHFQCISKHLCTQTGRQCCFSA